MFYSVLCPGRLVTPRQMCCYFKNFGLVMHALVSILMCYMPEMIYSQITHLDDPTFHLMDNSVSVSDFT